MAWTVIANPAAGRGRTRRMLPDLARAAEGVGAEFRVSRDSDDAVALATGAAGAGRDLVACGGDGMVGTVAGVAAEHGCRVAVVPSGAGNDFARVLGYDTDHPLSAFDVVETGSDRVVDLARVNGRSYTCVAAIGFDAEANRWANTRRHLSGTALYVAAALRTLAVYRPQHFELEIDGAASTVEAWLVAVGNAPSYGGGMRITPDARLDDGLVDVTIVGPVGRVDFLRTFPKVFKGTHVAHPLVTTARGRTVRVAAPDAPTPMAVYADGESAGELPVTIEAWAAALRVRVPAEPTR